MSVSVSMCPPLRILKINSVKWSLNCFLNATFAVDIIVLGDQAHYSCLRRLLVIMVLAFHSLMALNCVLIA